MVSKCDSASSTAARILLRLGWFYVRRHTHAQCTQTYNHVHFYRLIRAGIRMHFLSDFFYAFGLGHRRRSRSRWFHTYFMRSSVCIFAAAAAATAQLRTSRYLQHQQQPAPTNRLKANLTKRLVWCAVYDRENISGWDWTTMTIVAVCHDSKAAFVCYGIASYVPTIIYVYYTTFRKYFYMNFGWLFSAWVEWRMTLLLRATKTKFITIIFVSFFASILYACFAPAGIQYIFHMLLPHTQRKR